MTSTTLISTLIKGRWKVNKKIGQGAFGDIYQAKNIMTNDSVAIKVEKVDSKKQVLKLEVAVLKRLQDCTYVCRFITCGRFGDFNYMVMELLGENLSEIRRKQPDQKFSLGVACKLGMQMLKALEAVHELGYLHRDVKPSNFALGLTPDKRNKVYLIDFGLSRRFVLPNGEVRPARESAGFRGTARYASVNSHLSKDLGRRDDLWCLFYVLIEFARGTLPWRKMKDKDQIGEMKIQSNTAELVKGLPAEYQGFMEHLQTLQYHEKPDYKFLFSLLQDMLDRVETAEEQQSPLDVQLALDKKIETESPRALDGETSKANIDITAQQRTISQMKTMTDVSAVHSQISNVGRNTFSRATGKSNADIINSNSGQEKENEAPQAQNLRKSSSSPLPEGKEENVKDPAIHKAHSTPEKIYEPKESDVNPNDIEMQEIPKPKGKKEKSTSPKKGKEKEKDKDKEKTQCCANKKSCTIM